MNTKQKTIIKENINKNRPTTTQTDVKTTNNNVTDVTSSVKKISFGKPSTIRPPTNTLTVTTATTGIAPNKALKCNVKIENTNNQTKNVSPKMFFLKRKIDNNKSNKSILKTTKTTTTTTTGPSDSSPT